MLLLYISGTYLRINLCAIDRIRGAGATTPYFDSAPVQVETWDDLVNVGKQKKAAKYVHNAHHTGAWKIASKKPRFLGFL